ncbi:hypothetical protein GCM10020331_005650 [Ectobacillus funiculus]
MLNWPALYLLIISLFQKNARGQGLGHKLIEKNETKKEKPILLEVEPVNYEDSDTEKKAVFFL